MRNRTSRLFAAGDGSGGLYTSTNGGVTWTPINTGFTPSGKWGGYFIQDIIVNQKSAGVLFASSDKGIHKSINNGRTWRPVNKGLVDLRVGPLAIDPKISNRLYAGTASGLYRSVNAGASWTVVNGIPKNIRIGDIVINPKNPNILHVMAFGGTKVYKSVNGGKSWLSEGRNIAGYALTKMAIDPINPETVYMGTLNNGIFKTVLTRPAAPSKLTSVAFNSKIVRLRWRDNSSDELRFHIYRRAGKAAPVKIGQALANSTTFVDRRAITNRDNTYSVAAVNAAGASARTASSVRVLGQPVSLKAKVNVGKRPSVSLHWIDRSRGEQRFLIQRKNGKAPWQTVGRAIANSKAFTDKRVRPKSLYRYRIRAMYIRSGSSWSNQVVARTR